jgi:hypothetical protein
MLYIYILPNGKKFQQKKVSNTKHKKQHIPQTQVKE